MDEVRILEIKQSVFKNNDEQADKLRRELKEKGVFLLNLMSSPGAGKTTTLKATIAALKDKVKIGINAPKEVKVIRSELKDARQTNEQAAHASGSAIAELLKQHRQEEN